MVRPAAHRGFLGFVGRLAIRSLQLLLLAAVAFLLYSAYVSYHYAVPFSTAAKDVGRQVYLESLRAVELVHEPCEVKVARVGPDEPLARARNYRRVEEVLPPGQALDPAQDLHVVVEHVHNEEIVNSSRRFRYQTHDEPRLHELRRKYRFDEVVAPATTEFEAMVLLRNWARSQFRRNDFQPDLDQFDALAYLDRNWRDRGEAHNRTIHLDPCEFFPLLCAQVLVSMGYTARLVSLNDHGNVEVWSNQFRKWVVLDAELNLHYEKDGIPLNMVELLEENYAEKPSRVEIIRGEQTSGDENTTMVFLKLEVLPVETALKWYNAPLDVVTLRNDWMSNHYFRGHPARSDLSSLIYLDPRVTETIPFSKRLRPVTARKEDAYWTLNQTEILARPLAGDEVDLGFRTVTPNFQCFEIAVDGGTPTRSPAPTFRWHLHQGVNTISVRTINQFGVAGTESSIRLSVRPR